MTTRMQTKKSSYTFDYDIAVDAAKTQRSIFWTPDEIEVEKDIQDMRVNMTEAEAHGITTTLKLFTLYELEAGAEYWGRRVMRMFPRPDIQQMANAFSFFELNVHAPFYNAINEALMINTDEFYLSYLEDPVLGERMEFIEEVVCHEDDLVSLGAFSIVEGAILYSAFAFLMHFQAKGKNKMKNVCSGVKFSVRDENLHSEGGAWLFRTLRDEKLASGDINEDDVMRINAQLLDMAGEVLHHESAIIDKIFEKGDIEGINKEQLKEFVNHRIDFCLGNLGIKIEKEVEGVIEKWFYPQINATQMHDFFAGMGSEYNRDWKEDNFKW